MSDKAVHPYARTRFPVPCGHRALAQAYEFRDFAAASMSALRTTPVSCTSERIAQAKALRDLAAVWDLACDRVRIIRGKGLPKPVESRRKPKAAQSFAPPPPQLPA